MITPSLIRSHANGPAPCGAARLLAALLLAVTLAACGSEPRPRATSVDIPRRDVHPALRGTIGAQAALSGDTSAVVSGIGLVVGLSGTGGQVLNEQIFATLERELSLRGVGTPGEYEGTLFEGKSPREVLQDENVAAVLVQAALPPGTRTGDRFDVFVRALNASSLEGGRLLTTDLRIGDAVTFGGPQGRIMGRASGDLFINPFADPNGSDQAVTRTSGRILNGGEATEELLIRVDPDNPSHTLARLIVSSINTRFPRDERSRRETAMGRGAGRAEVDEPRYEGVIQVRIPDRYADQPEHFVELLRHLQVDTTRPTVYARQYVTTLQSEPGLGEAMAFCLEAIGEKAIPFVRDLYEFPETTPRLRALQAGANLGDPAAVPHLIELAQGGPPLLQLQAINLLGRMPAKRGLDPRADRALADLLSRNELNVRVAAYEALARRAETAHRRRLMVMNENPRARGGRTLSEAQIDLIAATTLPPGTLQVVSRVPIRGKFLLDRVPVGDPLVYITQQGIPRIVLFGRTLELERPAFVTAWDGRFTMVANGETDRLRVLYRKANPDGVGPDSIITERVSDSLVEFIDFLAHEPTGGLEGDSLIPGLDLTYSQVVGVLHEVWLADAMNAAFATERDRLFADLSTSRAPDPVVRRPLSPEDRREVILFDEPEARPIERDDRGPGGDEERDNDLLEPIIPVARGEEDRRR